MRAFDRTTLSAGDVFTSNEGYDVVVLGFSKTKGVLVQFDDERQYTMCVTAQNLRNGQVKNPYHPSVYGFGYIGIGPYKAKIDRKNTREYAVWSAIIRRSCTEFWTTKPSLKCYEGSSISKEWLCFQVFAKWLTENPFYELGYQVDKDLIKKGNKHYSPETCALIPQEINKLLYRSEERNGLLPTGVCSNGKKFQASLSRFGEKIYLGTFNCPNEAHQAYVVAKEAYVKEVANEWHGRIDERVYKALMNWRVAK